MRHDLGAILPTPFRRAQESARPDTALFVARLTLLGGIIVAEGHRPTLLDHPEIELVLAGAADPEKPVMLVSLMGYASHAATGDKAPETPRGFASARPRQDAPLRWQVCAASGASMPRSRTSSPDTIRLSPSIIRALPATSRRIRRLGQPTQKRQKCQNDRAANSTKSRRRLRLARRKRPSSIIPNPSFSRLSGATPPNQRHESGESARKYQLSRNVHTRKPGPSAAPGMPSLKDRAKALKSIDFALVATNKVNETLGISAETIAESRLVSPSRSGLFSVFCLFESRRV